MLDEFFIATAFFDKTPLSRFLLSPDLLGFPGFFIGPPVYFLSINDLVYSVPTGFSHSQEEMNTLPPLLDIIY